MAEVPLIREVVEFANSEVSEECCSGICPECTVALQNGFTLGQRKLPCHKRHKLEPRFIETLAKRH